MINLTQRKLQNYVRDYNYDITLEQAKIILEILDDYYGTFTNTEIEEVTDYVINDAESVFANYFN